MAKKTAKSAVGCQLTQEDADIAMARDQWNCAIVRCIQRTLPDSKRVKVNKDHISFSLDRDDIRYTFITPEELVSKVIRRFDKGLAPELVSFVLTDPISAEPVQHRTVEERQAHRMGERTRRRTDNVTKSGTVATYGRFLDAEAM